MRFKQFLAEGDHKRDISMEEAFELLKANCKSALKHVDAPLWRGTKRSAEDAYFIHGGAEEATGRKSANTTNHYTMLMDTFLPYYGYPLRSRSIIFATNKNEEYASSFGRLYAIFPYDGTPIGVCSEHDLWNTEPFEVGNSDEDRRINGWNHFWRDNKISSASWKEFERTMTEKMTEAGNHGRSFTQWFGPPEKLRAIFEKAYGPENLKLELTDAENVYNIDGEHELWMSGKCIAIKASVYRDHLSELRDLR
ncbi:hypothetical protein [Acinetobacter sp.]|uniref:hypothetical protein n=1 Tax=Acinetobacter sp. TaxID=472 RepID=UPI00388E60D1